MKNAKEKNNMYNLTLNPLTPLTPLDLTSFFEKKSIKGANKHVNNLDRKGIWFEDKPEFYVAKLNVAGYDKSEIKITEEKSSSSSSKVDVICENEEFLKLRFSFYLPNDADCSSIKSTLKNSILTISSEKKKTKVKSSSIEIE